MGKCFTIENDLGYAEKIDQTCYHGGRHKYPLTYKARNIFKVIIIYSA